MSEISHFRGYQAIKEIVDYMNPLAEWMAKFKPDTHDLTLKGPDYDVIARWPKAAAIHNIRVSDAGDILFKGFKLKRDKKPFRYSQKNPPRDDMQQYGTPGEEH
jgi:hypothetical protein